MLHNYDVGHHLMAKGHLAAGFERIIADLPMNDRIMVMAELTKMAEEVKQEIYEIANGRTMAEGKTVSIACIGRELLDIGLATHKKKNKT